MASSLDPCTHRHALALRNLFSSIRDLMPVLKSADDADSQRIAACLQEVLNCRDPAVFAEGKALNFLWSLDHIPDANKEVVKLLRVVVARRAHNMLYYMLYDILTNDVPQSCLTNNMLD